MTSNRCFGALLFLLCGFSLAAEPLPEYQKARGISGTISTTGSDTLANLMTQWAEGFKYYYPNVNFDLQAAGSSSAPPALAMSTSQLGPMSRLMKASEVDAFVRQFGYPPMAIRVAVDALAVFVHKDNPITQLQLADIDGIFSVTQRCGGDSIQHWGQLGLGGSWQQRRIQLYGRNSVSGTYGDFKLRALCNGDFKASVNEQPGSASVVQSVATSLNAVGYSGMGYQTAGVRTVALSKGPGQPYITATPANAVNGQYPLSRYLYVYINKHPNQALDPLLAEFIQYILSAQGQFLVAEEGYVALPNVVVERQLQRLGLADGH